MAAGDCDDSRPPAPASREGLLTFRMAIEQARNERRIGPAFEPKKLRLYVSGPMTGLPALNFPAFMAAALQLRGLGFEAINPAELNPDPGKSWAECMRVDIKALMDCEGVALLPGWLDSKGARVEYDLAQTLGMEVRELAGWLLKSEYRPYETSRGDEVANEKRLNRVAASFGDSEFNALSRLANADNRSVSECLYVIAMRFMFGAAGVDRKQNDCDTLQQRERA